MSLKTILAAKGDNIICIESTADLAAAAKLLSTHRIGAVVRLSRFKEDAWFAIRSTLTATRGKIRIIGNVKGKSNWFYHLARRAEEEKHPELAYHRLTAYDAIAAEPARSLETIEW